MINIEAVLTEDGRILFRSGKVERINGNWVDSSASQCSVDRGAHADYIEVDYFSIFFRPKCESACTKVTVSTILGGEDAPRFQNLPYAFDNCTRIAFHPM